MGVPQVIQNETSLVLKPMVLGIRKILRNHHAFRDAKKSFRIAVVNAGNIHGNIMKSLHCEVHMQITGIKCAAFLGRKKCLTCQTARVSPRFQRLQQHEWRIARATAKKISSIELEPTVNSYNV